LGIHQLKSVLLHELAHIKRGDLWVSFIQTILQIIYFYNPLLWLANAVIRQVREQAVDEMVMVALGEEAEDYPETLVNVFRLSFNRPALGLRLIGVVESKSSLRRRVKHMLHRPMPKRAKLGIVGLVVVMAIAAVLLPMAKGDEASNFIQPFHEGISDVQGEEDTSPENTESISDVIRPPFMFTIYTKTLQGEPQPGVSIRCFHPRSSRGDPIVDMTTISDETGEARFEVSEADILSDRYFWFSLADSSFVSQGGIGISPIDNEYHTTFTVSLAKEYKIQVTDDSEQAIVNAKVWLTADHPKFPRVDSNVFRASSTVYTDSKGTASARFAEVNTNIVASAQGYASSFLRGMELSEGEPLKIRLGKGYTIKGDILSEQTFPLHNIQITARRKDFILDHYDQFTLKAYTDSKGHFTLRHASEGDYEILAHTEEAEQPFCIDSVTVQVGEVNPVPHVVLSTSAGAILKGRYITKHNLRISDRQIFISTFSPKSSHWELKTADDGLFSITNLPRQSYLLLSKPGHEAQNPPDDSQALPSLKEL